MELIRTADELRTTGDAWRAAGSTVALVPTMGALHEGHDALVRCAAVHGGRVLVTIFVNPAQFGPDEDLATYPRDLEADLDRCRALGVDAVWAPPVEEVYPRGVALTEPDPGPVGETFEGAARPGHFRGVLKVVHRLFELTGRCRAVFGEKDAQQLFLVRRMVRLESLPVEVVASPMVREPDGLAASSRNRRLSAREREQAPSLFLGLSEAAALARGGEHDPAVLVAAIAREVGASPIARLDYAAIVDDTTFEPATRVNASSRALVAARFPSARLIDNLRLPTP